MSPPVPTLVVTAFGMVCPVLKLMLDAVGWLSPSGQIVRNELAVPPVTVTLRTTESAPLGTVVAPPVTVTSRATPGPHLVL